MSRDSFSTYNPGINFLFYIGAVLFGMFFIHPAFLGCSCILAMIYYATVRGIRALKLIGGMIPLFILLAVINPFFNIYGQHVLFTYLGGRPYTFEAMCYGMAVAGMFVTIIMWFASYNMVMTGDKFMYIFGRMAPSITLVLTMVMRFVPSFRKKAIQIAAARKSVGKAGDSGSGRDKVENGMIIVSALTNWALEGGIITADSMQSRGYGCGQRTAFSIYRFAFRDVVLLSVMLLLMAAIIFCGLNGGAATTYTPEINIAGFDNLYSLIGIVCYFVFLAIPTALNIGEEITWRILRSRI